MKRGGAREGAGRKSPWSSSDTKAIRVPEYLADEVLAFARQLDRERSLTNQQERLADLLEEFLQLSQENRQEWIEQLPDIYKEVIGNADIRRGVSQARTITLETYPDDEDEQPMLLSTNFTLKDLGAFRIVELSNGQRLTLERKNGRLVCPALGLPEEEIKLDVSDQDGKVYLQILSQWNIDHLVSATSKPPEQSKGSLDPSSKDVKKSKTTGKEKKSKGVKTGL